MERSGYQRELFRNLDCGTTLMVSGASDPGAAAGINCSYRSGYACFRTGPSATADIEGVLSRVPRFCARSLSCQSVAGTPHPLSPGRPVWRFVAREGTA